MRSQICGRLVALGVPARLSATEGDAVLTEPDARVQVLRVEAREDLTFPFSVLGTPEQYVRSRGRLELELRVTSDTGDVRTIEGTLVGPSTLPRPPAS